MISRVLLRRLFILPFLATAIACSDDEDDNLGPGSGSFQLGSPAQATLTMMAGGSAQTTVPVTTAGNFGRATLTADSVPVGLIVGFGPSVIVPGITQTTVNVTSNPTMAPGSYRFRVRAVRAPADTQSTVINVTVTGQPNFTVAVTPDTVVIQRTQSGTATVNLTRLLGFTGDVTIFADSLPRGVTATTVGTPGNQATITFNTASNAQATTHTIRLRATNPSVGDRTVLVRLRILAEPGVQITAPATASMQQSNTMNLPVTVNREGGFTGPVTVTLSGLPTGVTAAPVTSASGTTVNVPITISDAAAAATSNITVSVSGTGIETKTATTALTITSSLLTSGTGRTVADARARGSVLYYRVNVPVGATSLRVTLMGGTGDGDIYLIPGVANIAAATHGSFEVDNNENVLVNAPTPGVWYIGVEVWNPYAGATLTATVTGPDAAGLMAAQGTTTPTAKFVVRRNKQ